MDHDHNLIRSFILWQEMHRKERDIGDLDRTATAKSPPGKPAILLPHRRSSSRKLRARSLIADEAVQAVADR